MTTGTNLLSQDQLRKIENSARRCNNAVEIALIRHIRGLERGERNKGTIIKEGTIDGNTREV
jgi:hypothetical protein